MRFSRTVTQNVAQKWVALELMLSTSNSVVALAKKMAKPETKTLTRTISIPKTKVIKQLVQQTGKLATNDAAQTAIQSTIPSVKVQKLNNKVRFLAVYNSV